MNLAANLTRSAAAHPDRVGIRMGERTIDYRALDDASSRVAGLLTARGLGLGSRVGIMLPNVPEFAVVYYGVLRAGGVVVPMNPLLKSREVAYYLGDSGASVIFAWHGVAGEIADGVRLAGAEAIVVDPSSFNEELAAAGPASEVVDRADDDTAVILYTSGTTGQPKGAELTHAGLIANVCATAGPARGTDNRARPRLPCRSRPVPIPVRRRARQQVQGR
ncbi:MAG TPA: AMP-binding protein [Kineosporiaceae bacterium]|nr:AMP-binding protein [Kineosporiaceae bacterium]